MTIRVIAIDDSQSMRSLYSCLLQSDGIEIVATAEDPIAGRDLVIQHKPDVVLLDLEMPHMDGITFLRQLMNYHPIPVLIISALTSGGDAKAVEALRAGAIDVIPKIASADRLVDFGPVLREKIIAASHAKPERIPFVGDETQVIQAASAKSSDLIIVIGASTGGTSAVELLLKRFKKNTPGTLVCLHLPEKITKHFAKRLNEILHITVKLAEEGDVISDGTVLVTPGHHQTTIRRVKQKFEVDRVLAGNEEEIIRLPINRLFESVATAAGERAMGVLLTGMGDDGARGLLSMRKAGAMTVAEHESSCVVYGMPKVANEMGAAWRMLPLQQINSAIIEFAALNSPPDKDEL